MLLDCRTVMPLFFHHHPCWKLRGICEAAFLQQHTRGRCLRVHVMIVVVPHENFKRRWLPICSLHLIYKNLFVDSALMVWRRSSLMEGNLLCCELPLNCARDHNSPSGWLILSLVSTVCNESLWLQAMSLAGGLIGHYKSMCCIILLCIWKQFICSSSQNVSLLTWLLH